ncbi:GNAT family N-acetyltransferase [Streptococcus iniae]
MIFQNCYSCWRKLGGTIKRFSTDLFRADGGKFDAKELELLLYNPNKPIYVYTDDHDKVLGHLFLQFKVSESPVRIPRKVLYVEDLCVNAHYRGQGIGRQLMAFAKDFAREKGCYQVTLNVWNANKEAYAFYERLGFVPQQTQMERNL